MDSRLSTYKFAGYFLLVSIVITVILFIILNTFNVAAVIKADFYALIISPYLSSIILNKKLGLPLSENKAEKIANVYILFYIMFFYIAIFLYINTLSEVDRVKLSEHVYFIGIAFSIMSLATYFLGKWTVIIHLTKNR